MGTLTIRKVDDDVKRRLQVRAARNGRSMEAEVRAILDEAVAEGDGPEREPTLGEVMAEFRARTGGVDLELPPREDFDDHRVPDFS
ncbi:plasmid stability protein [Knoellia remsis]|uniref:Plasmid stability protein n=1 Tax=Knoellia remsis TaxID=407159 RepID=A0A2T0UU69_9MICO|nr:plasmid stabilization protein [Knoellia remsis]PRY61466.1 plasmid stability protein [Knoellia remsis]